MKLVIPWAVAPRNRLIIIIIIIIIIISFCNQDVIMDAEHLKTCIALKAPQLWERYWEARDQLFFTNLILLSFTYLYCISSIKLVNDL